MNSKAPPERLDDRVEAGPLAGLAATLDLPGAPAPLLPPLWHWLYFLPRHKKSELGEDGHPRRGGFLPELGLPRRMWAGGQLQFHRPLRVGESITRVSSIESVEEKSGRSGRLAFVKVRHDIESAGERCITEHQDIVYREPAKPGEAPAGKQAPAGAAWERRWDPDEPMLFRYSALTFNGHRIHYDRPYATRVEGYPALVVHGPLIATLLAELVREHRPGAALQSFEFRAVSPLFCGAPLYACGEPEGSSVRLWARDGEGRLAMEAKAAFS